MIIVKSVKKVACSYVFKRIMARDIVELINLFHAKNLFIEIINIRTESTFCENIRSRKINYVTSSCFPVGTYVDIIIPQSISENYSCIIEEIIESDPETLLFYLTDSSFEQFLYCCGKTSIDKLVSKQVSSFIMEIIFSENTVLISYNAELYNHSDLASKIDGIMAEWQR